MGERGTDVARGASSRVLLDDNFGAMVRAVRLGRHIFDNLRKAMAFVLAVHVPPAELLAAALGLGLGVLLLLEGLKNRLLLVRGKPAKARWRDFFMC